MRLDIIWNQETTPVDLADGVVSLGGSARDGICIAGLPHGLLSFQLEGGQLRVTAARSMRIGQSLFPARVPRLLVEGEELKLANDVVIRRPVDEKRRQARNQVSTALVARELLTGALMPQYTRAATFTCVAGLDQGRIFPVAFTDNLIGRADDAAIRIRDRAVSRRHAKLVRQGRDYVLQLVTSAMNGVYLNGKLVKKSTALTTGDVIELGQTVLRFDTAERAPEERTVLHQPEPALPVPPPLPAERPRGELNVTAPLPLRRRTRVLNLETVLLWAGGALTILGALASLVMLLR